LPKDALPQQIKHPAFLSGVLVDTLFRGFPAQLAAKLVRNRDSENCERHSDKTAGRRLGMRWYIASADGAGP
jgi:hypothetical protein